ncbi:hypothetical protein GCM10020370_62920 [Paenibacillus hodogayensis]
MADDGRFGFGDLRGRMRQLGFGFGRAIQPERGAVCRCSVKRASNCHIPAKGKGFIRNILRRPRYETAKGNRTNFCRN